jgi:hypothetical protein
MFGEFQIARSMGAFPLSGRRPYPLFSGDNYPEVQVNPDVLKRICELQPRYSPTNTPEMK